MVDDILNVALEASRSKIGPPLSKDELAKKTDASLKRFVEIWLSTDKFELFPEKLKPTYLRLGLYKYGRFESLISSIRGSGNTNSIVEPLLLYLDTSELPKAFEYWQVVQAFVELLSILESQPKTTISSPEQVRYLNTLKRIQENLNKQSNPAAVTNAS